MRVLAIVPLPPYHARMSELPPNIDAILASIRSRMTDDAPPSAAPVAEPAVPPIDIGAVVVEPGAMTIDALVRAMLEPMLKAWLDANMPEMVERLAQQEIRRLTGRD